MAPNSIRDITSALCTCVCVRASIPAHRCVHVIAVVNECLMGVVQLGAMPGQLCSASFKFYKHGKLTAHVYWQTADVRVYLPSVHAYLQAAEDESQALKDVNQDLSTRCKSQQQTINKFVAQFKELQQEMRQLVTLHTEQTEVVGWCRAWLATVLLFVKQDYDWLV